MGTQLTRRHRQPSFAGVRLRFSLTSRREIRLMGLRVVELPTFSMTGQVVATMVKGAGIDTPSPFVNLRVSSE